MAKLLRWLGITLLVLAGLAMAAALWMGLDFGSRPAKSIRPLAVASDVRFVEANGIRFAYLEAGKGPLVVLFHGYPETARSSCKGLRMHLSGARGRRTFPAPDRVADAIVAFLATK